MMPDLMTGATPLLNLPAVRSPFMGIDASLTATGVAIVARGKIKMFTLSPPKGKSRGAKRLGWFLDEFTGLIYRYKPGAVAIEGYAFGAKMKREAMGELGGMLRLALDRALPGDEQPLVVPPSSLKTFATGVGNAGKDVVMKEAYKRWGIDTTDNNQCDAAILAIMALARHLPNPPLTKAQATALAKLGPEPA